MTTIAALQARLNAAFDAPGLEVPAVYVKFYRRGETIPAQVKDYEVEEETLTSCQAARHAMAGHAVLLTKANVGCIAAAISLGLVDQDDPEPLDDPRVYTGLMKAQLSRGMTYHPPSPQDFTAGRVYACKAAGLPEFCLFGPEDSGRFKDVATARKAVAAMTAIQPAVMAGVFLYGDEFEELDLTPDVVVLSLRAVELARLVQAYSFQTGERIEASMGAVRVVNSDLIARPFLTGQINVSSYCVGARLVAQYEGDRLGLGAPLEKYKLLVEGMEASRTGFPFAKYPGALTD